MNNNLLMTLPGIESEELLFAQEAIKDLSEEQQKNFFLLYSGRRKDPQTILICALLGFVGVAGVHRFLVGQIGMGVLFFFTAGLCFVGTIIDLMNYKKLALEFNQRQVIECKLIAGSMGA
ncbi:MAG: TM2 domain-containing protein [Bacteroidetes bacterium]|nr:TM2 domain-containing protein [Bacteroidota bacterium]